MEACVSRHVCGCQRMTCGCPFSLSTMCPQRDQTWVISLGSKFLHPLGYLTSLFLFRGSHAGQADFKLSIQAGLELLISRL